MIEVVSINFYDPYMPDVDVETYIGYERLRSFYAGYEYTLFPIKSIHIGGSTVRWMEYSR